MNALRTRSVTKRYGGKRAVDGVSMALERGEVYGLVGPNGSGKSTLMKLMAGRVFPTEGSVEVFGEVMRPGQMSPRVGALIEQPNVDEGLSALDNVRYRALALGLAHPREESLRAIEDVGLRDAATERVRGFSLGMKQRLGLALALVGSPDVLLLDEPLNGLDLKGVREVRALVKRMAETRGVAVLVSSHVLDHLERMVTRYGVMGEGRLLRELTAREVERARADFLCVRAGNPAVALVALEAAFPQVTFEVAEDDLIWARGEVDEGAVGDVLLRAGVSVAGMHRQSRDIEELFAELMCEDARGGICHG